MIARLLALYGITLEEERVVWEVFKESEMGGIPHHRNTRKDRSYHPEGTEGWSLLHERKGVGGGLPLNEW